MDAVAEATTLIKLNHGFGRQRVAKLNQELVGSLVKSRSIKARRIRIDSATLQAHISYPNDSTQLLCVVSQSEKRLGVKPKEVAADRGY